MSYKDSIMMPGGREVLLSSRPHPDSQISFSHVTADLGDGDTLDDIEVTIKLRISKENYANVFTFFEDYRKEGETDEQVEKKIATHSNTIILATKKYEEKGKVNLALGNIGGTMSVVFNKENDGYINMRLTSTDITKIDHSKKIDHPKFPSIG